MSTTAQLAGSYVCASSKAYVPDCGPLTLTITVGPNRTHSFNIKSNDASLDDTGTLLASKSGDLTLKVSDAGEPMSYTYRIVPGALELTMEDVTDVWVRQ